MDQRVQVTDDTSCTCGGACGMAPAGAHGVPGRPEADLLFAATFEAALLVGPGGAVLRANQAACELLHMDACRLRRPAGVRRLFAPRDRRVEALIGQWRRDGRAAGCLTALRGDGSPVEVQVRLVRCLDGDGTPHAFVAFRCAAPAFLPGEAVGSDLQHMAPSLAHDLRAPIGTLAGFAKALERALGENAPERSRHYVERILAAVGQLEDHVEALLAFARVAHAPLEARRVDLSAVARRVLRDLQLREMDRIVTVQVQDGICADGDPHLLKIVLENLLGNAWKFTRRRGQATIEFGAELSAQGEVVYRVRDNGVGFDMAYVGKLFREFQRLHSQAEFPGTGIGLANVQRIVERHGGRVWAESAPGQGATFCFTVGACATPRAGRRAAGDCEDCPHGLEPPLRDEVSA